MLESTIRRVANRLGLDIRRRHNNTQYTLLGIRDRRFNTILDIGANLGQSAKLYR